MSTIDNKAKILTVSRSLFPGRSGSAFIMEKLARCFSSDEMVLLGELPVSGGAIPRRDPQCPQATYFRSGFSLGGRGKRFFDRLRWKLLSRLVKRICRLALDEGCTHILAVYPDEFYCYAACLAAEKLNLPFSTYFHNTYLDNASINRKRALQIQPRLFDRSQVVFVMSDGMRRHFEEEYQLTNVVSLLHTFSEYPETSQAVSVSPGSSKQRLVLFGNFNSSNIEATKRFVDTVVQDGRYELHMYTNVPSLLLSHRGIDMRHVDYHGFIDDAKLVSELQKYDIVVLTHGFDGEYGLVEYQTIFPTRTIPMLLSGRPIFVHSPPHAFITHFFREHRAGWVVDEPSPARIIDGLETLFSGRAEVEDLVGRARKLADMFYGPKVAQVLRTSFLEAESKVSSN